MANAITSQTITDGDRNTVLKIYISGDGTGEETDTVVFDASAVVPSADSCSIMNVEGYLVGFSALLEFDATTDVPAINLPGDDQFCFELDRRYSGIPNNAGTGKTGDITMTTTGLGAGDIGWFVIEVKKG